MKYTKQKINLSDVRKEINKQAWAGDDEQDFLCLKYVANHACDGCCSVEYKCNCTVFIKYFMDYSDAREFTFVDDLNLGVGDE